MQVNIKKAVKMFFSKSSFEMIYFEAIANALDAGATNIDIKISLADTKQISNLTLEIDDNGVGFEDERFNKFNKLFEVEEQSHKGLGRLVYLCYFDNIHVKSIYQNEGLKERIFDFNENFAGESIITDTAIQHCGSSLTMTGFNGDKLHKNENIRPDYIKRVILENFYMKLYKAKLAKKSIKINIFANIAGSHYEEFIESKAMPELKTLSLDHKLDLINSIDLYYYINKVDDPTSKKIITALAVDDRCHKVDKIIAEENIPLGYDMVFLLISESFLGAVDEARQNLTIPESNMNAIKGLFRNAIATVLKTNIPQIEKRNTERREHLTTTYPHLSGYFTNDDIGFASHSEILKDAQEKFFRDQREILSATHLNEEQFKKSLDLSARALAEYILFRQNVIKKMRALDKTNIEADLHNLIAPKHSEFKEGELSKDLYKNNVWVLDDKFMSYCTVLSEAEMSKVINVLTAGEETKNDDDDRPDIAIFFSSDPNKEGSMFDVVIIELKRLGLTAENNSIVEFQLDTRAQKLAEYYGKRVQRMWFYGVVEFNDKYETHLVNSQFNPLYSNGNIYFRSKIVYTDKNKTSCVIQNAYIMDFKALVEDANSRNETFLTILRNQFEKS